ncbi:FAD-dependent oxidoreductase [Saccharobesus litoralis]|uniref:D-amino-acid oxidase n=1 Tax=Saccharobesus litoralis TaxID=2172099 RepID=A0A2S0VMB7_9ALTE|nr:FAD-dependent oxidoreductase [Saccharobesus litoralis]AWB65345.1 FAD-dependent oxidoreductase [Saccharobesus litoralis]
MKVAIVGAGLVGRLLSLLLAKESQFDVSLFEKNALNYADATGRIAASMIAPTAESVVASRDIVTMGHASLALWPELLQALQLTVDFQRQGSVILAHRQDEADLRSFMQRVHLQQDEDLLEIDAQQLNQIEPELANHFSRILFLPNEGQIENSQLYQQTASAILASSIQVYCQTEVKIDDAQISFNDERPKQKFDLVIDCRGLGAKGDMINQLKVLRGVRGEVIRVKAPEVNLTRPVRLMHPRYPIYIVPKDNQEYVIGATEIESQDDRPTSVRSALELLSAAYSVHKGFAEANIIAMQSGLRPTLNDNEPSIDVSQHHIQVNGLYRHGYLLTPYILTQLLNVISAKTNLSLGFSQQQLPEITSLIHYHETNH